MHPKNEEIAVMFECMKVTFPSSVLSWSNVRFIPFPRCQTLGLALLIAASFGTVAPRARSAGPEAPFTLERLGLVMGSSALIGEKVKDRNDRALGRIDDLILNLASGRVVVALIDSGGNTQTPVPPQSFQTPRKGMVVLDVEKRLFESAPRLPKTDSRSALDATGLEKTFHHFGQTATETLNGNATALASAASLRGVRLLSKDNEPSGLVHDTMVDLVTGRIVYLVVQPGAAPDLRSALYLVPPAAVQPDSASPLLVLKADRAHFLAGRSFQREFPTEACMPDMAADVFRHYGLPLPIPAALDPASGSLNACDGTPGAPNPTTPSRADVGMSKTIWDEIVRGANGVIVLSIKITTVNGQVTLTGKVKDEPQERLIVSVAQRIAGVGRVDNQLQIRARQRPRSFNPASSCAPGSSGLPAPTSPRSTACGPCR